MLSSIKCKYGIFTVSVCFICLFTTVLLANDNNAQTPIGTKINLALRRTGDALLKQSGDSTSRIPAVNQLSKDVWQLQLDQDFGYDQLPLLLQSSLEQYGINAPYEVAVKRCDDEVIDLGYHYLDLIHNHGQVPCNNRRMPAGCHFIEVTFLTNMESQWLLSNALWLIPIGILGFMGIVFFIKIPKKSHLLADVSETGLAFGDSILQVEEQILITAGIKQSLTFREAKLLNHFVINADKLLERENIIQHVWADEGVLVGRSVDVFVSRLRKKLAPDTTVAIAVVHGVGYRLETLS